MSDVDIVLEVAVNGIQKINDLSGSLKQLNSFARESANPIKALDARSRALNAAVGASGKSLGNYAKSLSQVATNQAVLGSEIAKTEKELQGLGQTYKFASGASKSYIQAGIQGLKSYNTELKKIKARALTEDLKSVALEMKRTGKDMQFVGRSLIIGLTTPLAVGFRQALQNLVAFDRETIRLTKVLEGVAPTADIALKKLNGITDPKAVQYMVDNYDFLNKKLLETSTRFGVARSLVTGLAADFAELGITNIDNIAAITDLTAATEKLGNMDISNAQDLVQSLYFQAVRVLAQSQPHLTAVERERKAIASATVQLNMFNMVENTTALTLKDLGDAFPEVAAAATTFGLSMTEAAAMLAPMKAAGFEVGASANAIKVSLQRMVAPTKANSEMMAKLSQQYGVHFKEVQGVGVNAVQALIDAYNTLNKTAGTSEVSLQFFSKLFGVRQGPRMMVAFEQMAKFDKILKDTSKSSEDLAEKKIQGIANSILAASDATLPLIKSYKDIAIVARIATASIEKGQKTTVVEGFGAVTQAQINAAKEARIKIGKEIAAASQQQQTEALKQGKKPPGDLISQIATESGRALITQLAGPANAAAVAQQELERTLAGLDVQLGILRNNFKNFASDLIKGITPTITKISEISQKLYESWKNLSPETKKLASNIALIAGGLTAAIGPMIFIAGQAKLAFGSVGRVLFSFLPGLKTMSIEALAGRSAMLRLKNPLTVVGETVVNTNSKFATWIATLASGDGKLKNFAERVGKLTGVLKQTTTAPVPLVAAINQEKASRGFGVVSGGGRDIVSKQISGGMSNTQIGKLLMRKGTPIPTITGLSSPFTPLPNVPQVNKQTVAKEALALRKLQVDGLRTLTGATKAEVAVAVKRAELMRLAQAHNVSVQDLFTAQQRLATGARTFATPGVYQAQKALQGKQSIKITKAMQGVGGRAGFTRFVSGATQRATRELVNTPTLLDSATLKRQAAQSLQAQAQAAQSARTAIQNARNAQQAAMAQQQKTAQQAAQKTIKDEFRTKRALSRRGVDYDVVTGQRSFKGRDITESQAKNIYRGGAKGALTRTGLIGQGITEGIKEKLPKPVDLNPIKAYKKSIEGAKDSIKALKSSTDAAVSDSPRLFAKMKAGMTGFMNATNLGTKALKLMKLAMLSSGIMVAILAISVAVMLVKNNMDKFKKAGSEGLKKIGDAFNIVKNALLEIVRPFMDLFAKFGSGSEGATGAVEGIGSAFNKLGSVIKWLANMFKSLVEKFIQPYLYMIMNIVGAVVSAFQGKWGKAFGFLKAAGAFATEFLVNAFALAFKAIISLIGMLVKGIISALGFAVKLIIDIFMKPFEKLPFGIGKKFKAISDGAKGMVDSATGSINGLVDTATKGVNGVIDKSAKGLKNSLKGLKKGGIDKSTGKVEIKIKPDPKSLDDSQEEIAKTVDDGMQQGSETGSKALAKKLASYRKKLIGELQEAIADRIKSSIESVVDSLTEGLKKQKEAAVKVFDDELQKIDDLKKAEEELTKTKEFENKKRELEEERALNRSNYLRNKALAIYEGRIDDARQLSLENAKNEKDSAKSLKELQTARDKDIADTARQNLIDQINKSKKEVGDFFDDVIQKFKDSAKKITEFPPTTAQEFKDQLDKLGSVANESATSMGTTMSSTFSGVLASLGTDATGPLTSSLQTISDLLVSNNPFGVDGVWQKAIDESITALTSKYSNLYNTLTTIIDDKTDAFKTLFDTYTKYQDLVAKNEAEQSGTGAAGGAGTSGGGAGNGTGTTTTSGKGTGRFEDPKTVATRLLASAYPNYNKTLGANAPKIITELTKILTYNNTHLSNGGVTALNWYKKNNKDWGAGYKALSYNIAYKALKSSMANKLSTIPGNIPAFAYGGLVPKFSSQSVPALLHGGEYVVNANAVKNIGLDALQTMNNMRFNIPKTPTMPGVGNTTSTQNINLYVDNFIGEQAWFESMMKDYNLKVIPANQKAAGLEQRTIRTYNGINRGM